MQYSRKGQEYINYTSHDFATLVILLKQSKATLNEIHAFNILFICLKKWKKSNEGLCNANKTRLVKHFCGSLQVLFRLLPLTVPIKRECRRHNHIEADRQMMLLYFSCMGVMFMFHEHTKSVNIKINISLEMLHLYQCEIILYKCCCTCILV